MSGPYLAEMELLGAGERVELVLYLQARLLRQGTKGRESAAAAKWERFFAKRLKISKHEHNNDRDRAADGKVRGRVESGGISVAGVGG